MLSLIAQQISDHLSPGIPLLTRLSSERGWRYGGTWPVERGNTTSCGLNCSYLSVPLLDFVGGVNTNAEVARERKGFNPTN